MQNDEDEINRLVLESEVIKRLKVDKEMVLAANRSLADSNLEQRPVLERNKNELGGMYETLNEVQEEFRHKSKSLKTTRGRNFLQYYPNVNLNFFRRLYVGFCFCSYSSRGIGSRNGIRGYC